MRIESEDEAERLVDSILRDAQRRRRCLEAFADAVREADRRSDGLWAVTCSKEKVRLVVGPVRICNIGDRSAGTERLWLALNKDGLTTSKVAMLEGSGDWEWSVKDSEYKAIRTRNGYYFPSERHDKTWPEIRELHFEAIRKAARRGGLQQRTKNRHSPGILEYIRKAVGQSVPDPAYSG